MLSADRFWKQFGTRLFDTLMVSLMNFFEKVNFKKVSRQQIYFLASSDFCRLLIAFVNSLEPDQDPQNVGPDLDPSCLTLG